LIGSGPGVLAGAVALALCASLVPAAPQGATDRSAQPPRRPNVVLLLADDLGWRDLGCTGSTFYETPHLDRLAAEGMSFTHAYAACPVCSPTRVSVLSGKYPARLATTDYFGGRRKKQLLPAPYLDHLPLEETTLAEAFRSAGYRTAFFGKWHLGGAGFGPLEQGFEVNVGGFERGHPPAGYFAPYRIPTLPDGPAGEHLTERLTDEACAFIDEHAEEPFFVMLAWYAVHTPLQTTPELQAKYVAKREALPAPEGPRFLPEGEREARQVQDHAVYAGMVESMDTSAGRVLAKLEELGLAGDTIVLFTSDNGGLSTSEGSPTSNVPLRAGKGWMYEGGIREPFLVRAPGITRAGTMSTVPVITTDIAPTLLALAGLEPLPAQHVDGVDLSALLAGGGAPQRDALFWHYPHYGNQGGSPCSAVRVGSDKLIEFFEDGRLELYDLAADPGEGTDLTAERPEQAAALHARLKAWRADVGARLPTPNPDFKR